MLNVHKEYGQAKWTNKGRKKQSRTLPKAPKQQNLGITKIDLPLLCNVYLDEPTFSHSLSNNPKIINLPSDSNDKSRCHHSINS